MHSTLHQASKHSTHSSIVTIVTKSWELSAENYLSVKVLSANGNYPVPFSQSHSPAFFKILPLVLLGGLFSQALWLFFSTLCADDINTLRKSLVLGIVPK